MKRKEEREGYEQEMESCGVVAKQSLNADRDSTAGVAKERKP